MRSPAERISVRPLTAAPPARGSSAAASSPSVSQATSSTGTPYAQSARAISAAGRERDRCRRRRRMCLVGACSRGAGTASEAGYAALGTPATLALDHRSPERDTADDVVDDVVSRPGWDSNRGGGLRRRQGRLDATATALIRRGVRRHQLPERPVGALSEAAEGDQLGPRQPDRPEAWRAEAKGTLDFSDKPAAPADGGRGVVRCARLVQRAGSGTCSGSPGPRPATRAQAPPPVARAALDRRVARPCTCGVARQSPLAVSIECTPPVAEPRTHGRHSGRASGKPQPPGWSPQRRAGLDFNEPAIRPPAHHWGRTPTTARRRSLGTGEEPRRAGRDGGYGVSSALASGRFGRRRRSTLQRLEHGLGAYIDSSQWPPAT